MAEPDPGLRELPLIVTADGLTIRGTSLIHRDLARAPALVILHGIPRAKPVPGDESYRRIAERFARLGFLSAFFNFRGAGLSEGDLSLAGWTRDLEAVLASLRDCPECDQRIVLLGFSAGASVAIYVAAHDPAVAAVVSVSSPADYSFLEKAMPLKGWVALFRELGLIRSPGFPPSLAAWQAEFVSLSPLPWVRLISPRPILFIHGEEDEVVPADHARALYDRAGEPRELILVPAGKHRLRVDPRALEIAENWLKKWINSSSK
jgi:fermentation-respiration switch protein FrsA (DUF1100 family)